jgi:hypothetical protein
MAPSVFAYVTLSLWTASKFSVQLNFSRGRWLDIDGVDPSPNSCDFSVGRALKGAPLPVSNSRVRSDDDNSKEFKQECDFVSTGEPEPPVPDAKDRSHDENLDYLTSCIAATLDSAASVASFACNMAVAASLADHGLWIPFFCRGLSCLYRVAYRLDNSGGPA